MDAILSSPGVLAVSIAVVLLLTSSIWAERRFARFRKLPAQFGADLKPTWFAPRSLVIWLTPVIFTLVLGYITWLMTAVPEEQVHGDFDIGLIVASVSILGAQLLILWLLTRWARIQF